MVSQSNSYIMSLLINDWRRYIEKMKEIRVGECPLSVCPSKWTSDPTQRPQVSYPDMYNYLTESPGNGLQTRFLTLTQFIWLFGSSVQCNITVH